MLTSKAILEETELANKIASSAKDPVAGCTLKMMTLILKMLASIRTNQVLLMTKLGVKKIEPPAKAGSDEKK